MRGIAIAGGTWHAYTCAVYLSASSPVLSATVRLATTIQNRRSRECRKHLYRRSVCICQAPPRLAPLGRYGIREATRYLLLGPLAVYYPNPRPRAIRAVQSGRGFQAPARSTPRTTGRLHPAHSIHTRKRSTDDDDGPGSRLPKIAKTARGHRALFRKIRRSGYAHRGDLVQQDGDKP